jgi:hypothetical protein
LRSGETAGVSPRRAADVPSEERFKSVGDTLAQMVRNSLAPKGIKERLSFFALQFFNRSDPFIISRRCHGSYDQKPAARGLKMLILFTRCESTFGDSIPGPQQTID